MTIIYRSALLNALRAERIQPTYPRAGIGCPWTDARGIKLRTDLEWNLRSKWALLSPRMRGLR